MRHLLLGTRKGLVVYEHKKGDWKYQGVHFLGIPVSMARTDARTGTWWVGLDHGHWGCKLHRSDDRGKTWVEMPAPKYAEGEEIKDGVPASLRYIWAITNGGKDQAGKLWIGTEPGGLFMSEDDGKSFTLNESLWQHPSRKTQWFGAGFDHPGIHSIIVDPRDSDHIYIGISCAGVFETKDGGATWAVRNKGLRADFLPNPYAEVGHDPHLLVGCAAEPDVLWQQNHCGIYRSTNGGQSWDDVTDENKLANFGFTIAVDAKDSRRAWVIPGIADEIRVAVDQALCVCRTDDGGKSWKTFRKGLPQDACFDIIYRHALDVSDNHLAFGTTTGNLFVSDNYGESWVCLNNYLPMVYSVHFTMNE